jgi:hypothetical protein
MKVIRYTIFDSLPDGNGAEKRTAQITEILKDAEIESLYVKRDGNVKVGLIHILFHAIPVLKVLTKIIPLSFYKNIKSILRAIRDYILTERNLLSALKSNAKILIWECTRSDNFFVPLLAQKYRKMVVAIPHNLESLVPNQVSTISLKNAPHWLNEEIKYLSACDMVFCISREETHFLKLFGIKSHYLPYFPTREIESFFIGIRKKRKTRLTANNQCKNVLMLGSANNQPTRQGMIDRIKFFSSSRPSEIRLTIGGYYTNTLSDDTEIPDNIHLAGTLTSEQLEKELLETDTILIHQDASSGALTRISEMLLAGIPVLLNSESAKNYYNIDGLYVYENDKQFMDLLQSVKIGAINVPVRPINDEQLFLEKIMQ